MVDGPSVEREQIGGELAETDPKTTREGDGGELDWPDDTTEGQPEARPKP